MNTFREIFEAKEYTMSDDDVRQAMAQSGKMKVKQLMDYMKFRHEGKYDPKEARLTAKELVADM